MSLPARRVLNRTGTRPLKCCALPEQTRSQRNHTTPATDLPATTISTQPPTLPPPATQHFVQEAFIIGSAMRKALSICDGFRASGFRRNMFEHTMLAPSRKAVSGRGPIASNFVRPGGARPDSAWGSDSVQTVKPRPAARRRFAYPPENGGRHRRQYEGPPQDPISTEPVPVSGRPHLRLSYMLRIRTLCSPDPARSAIAVCHGRLASARARCPM